MMLRKGNKVFRGAITLAFSKKSRKGLWWYDPKARTLELSKTARSHYNSKGFRHITDVRGWVRGMVFVKNRKLYILIYQCDFFLPAIPGEILIDLLSKIKMHYRKKIYGIVNEEDVVLLTSK